MVWPYPRNVILYARSSYYIMMCLLYAFFSDVLSDFKTCFGLLSHKNCGNVCHNVTFLDVTSTCFPSLVPCLQLTLSNVAAKAGNRR